MSYNSTLLSYTKKAALRFALTVSLIGLGSSLIGLANYINQPSPSQVLGATSGKEGYDLRFNTNTNGGLVFTGNSLCLSEQSASHGSCGTFITTNTTLIDDLYVPLTYGTTDQWQENSSTSQLVIPDGAEVLYAELIWGGSYRYLETDLTPQLDNPITLRTKLGEYTVNPDPETGGNITSSNSYVRSSDVTQIIQESGSSAITVGGVPGLIIKNNPYNNYVGYTLAVAYRDDTEQARNLSIFVGAEQVGADQFTNAAEVSGFSTPSSGDVNGRLFVSAGEGDSMYSGDQMRFGANPTNLAQLQGSNNDQSNFFSSQVNDVNGQLDQSGTFGSNNQQPGSSNVSAVRQGWDVTSVDISEHLSNNQTTAYAQGTSSGDSYVINALGMQIDINSAYPEVGLSLVGTPTVCVDEIITYQINVENTGTARSNATIVSELEMEGGEVNFGSVEVDSTPMSGVAGSIDLGPLEPGESKIITYEVTLTEVPQGGLYENSVTISYNYEMYEGGAVIEDTVTSDVVRTMIDPFCGIDQPPVAEDDEVTTGQETPVVISILDNDSDPDGATQDLNVTITTNPTNGNVVVNQDGTVTYTPDPGFYGEDTFVYQICDAENCDTATVTITVEQEMLYPPLAVDDAETTDKNTPVTILNLSNDSDQDGELDLSSVSIITQPTNGTVEVADNGSIVYTPNDNYLGEDTVVYEVCDNDGLCDQATVMITIDGELLPPVASDDSASTEVNTQVVIDNLNNDDPIEGELQGDTITIIENPTIGGVVVQNNELVYTPFDNVTGQDTFVYEVCNTNDLCDQATVTVDVINSNSEEPTPDGQVAGDDEIAIDAIDDAVSTSQDQPVTILVIDNDSANSIDSLQVLNPPSNGRVTLAGDNTVQYIPEDGFFGTDTFTYRICDNDGNCDTATVTVDVKPKGQVLGDSQLIRSGGGSVIGALGFGSLTGTIIYFLRKSRKKSKMRVTMG
jgi:hypothetical protein